MADFKLDDVPVVKASTLTTPNSIMIYGPPGKGKSVLASSIVKVPGFERTLALDTEGSMVAAGPHHPEVDVVPVPNAAKFMEYSQALMDGKFVERESGLPYQAVIVDTFDRAFERQLDVFNKSREATSDGKYNSYYQWGAIKTWTSKIADAYHQAPFLTIFVLHEDRDKDESTGKTLTTVLLAGKSQLSFPSVSDINAYMNVVPVPVSEGSKEKVSKRVAEFRPSDKIVAKQRFSDKLNVGMVDPTMEKVFRLIEPTRFES